MLHELTKQDLAALQKKAKKRTIRYWHKKSGVKSYSNVSKMISGNYPYPNSRKVDSRLANVINNEI